MSWGGDVSVCAGDVDCCEHVSVLGRRCECVCAGEGM